MAVLTKEGVYKVPHDIVVWKKACYLTPKQKQTAISKGDIWPHRYCLIKLLVTKGTLVNVQTGNHVDSRKCRAKKVKVIEFRTISGERFSPAEVYSSYRHVVGYQIGDTKVVKNFDETERVCSTGIHFFQYRSDAAAYDL